MAALLFCWIAERGSMRLLFFIFLSIFLNNPGLAACADPDGISGDVIYNDTYDVFQGCTTRGWLAFHAPDQPLPPAPTGPEGCPDIGDVCLNGVIYAGEFNGNKLYVAAEDAPTMLRYKDNTIPSTQNTSGIGGCATSPYTGGGCDTGRENTQLMKEHSLPFPAAEYCADLVAHGYDDWYLPARNELHVIYQNLKAGKPAGTHNFQNVEYWSSSTSASATSTAWQKNFSNGSQSLWSSIGNSFRVRCIWR